MLENTLKMYNKKFNTHIKQINILLILYLILEIRVFINS